MVAVQDQQKVPNTDPVEERDILKFIALLKEPRCQDALMELLVDFEHDYEQNLMERENKPEEKK